MRCFSFILDSVIGGGCCPLGKWGGSITSGRTRRSLHLCDLGIKCRDLRYSRSRIALEVKGADLGLVPLMVQRRSHIWQPEILLEFCTDQSDSHALPPVDDKGILPPISDIFHQKPLKSERFYGWTYDYVPMQKTDGTAYATIRAATAPGALWGIAVLRRRRLHPAAG